LFLFIFLWLLGSIFYVYLRTALLSFAFLSLSDVCGIKKLLSIINVQSYFLQGSGEYVRIFLPMEL